MRLHSLLGARVHTACGFVTTKIGADYHHSGEGALEFLPLAVSDSAQTLFLFPTTRPLRASPYNPFDPPCPPNSSAPGLLPLAVFEQ